MEVEMLLIQLLIYNSQKIQIPYHCQIKTFWTNLLMIQIEYKL